jgi:O-antigen ligase
MPPSRPPFSHAKIVESFRGDVRVPIPLHPFEKAFAIAASAHLCFLPWAIGARTPWAQVTSLCLGLLALAIALWPRRYEGELAPQGAFTLHPGPRLLRFPIFWLGLLFLGLVLCQALNPSWLRATAGVYWWIAKVEHITWLPSGVDAPFERMNAWRMLCIWGGAWALGCALWIGVTRRAGLMWVLNCVAVNGTVIALVAILQKVTGAQKILWVFPSIARSFHGTFVYENHAGAYLNLMLVLVSGLALWHYVRGLRRLERSTPAPIYVFMAVVIAASLLMGKSRAAIVLLVAFVVVALVVMLAWRARQGSVGGGLVTGLLVAGAIGFLATTAVFLNLKTGLQEVQTLWSGQDKVSMMVREKARSATLDMFEDRMLTGWGAGSFRHVFPTFQRNYPEIYLEPGGRRMFAWDHAHNDHVQLLAEVGVIGYGLVALGFVWGLAHWLGCRGFSQPNLVLYLMGLGFALAHAWVDFPLYNTAVLVTFVALGVATLRWAEIEQERR